MHDKRNVVCPRFFPKIADEWLDDMPKVTALILDQAVSLY
jgi:hypothetical protein